MLYYLYNVMLRGIVHAVTLKNPNINLSDLLTWSKWKINLENLYFQKNESRRDRVKPLFEFCIRIISIAGPVQFMG